MTQYDPEFKQWFEAQQYGGGELSLGYTFTWMNYEIF
jgi:hypothetical protein